MSQLYLFGIWIHPKYSPKNVPSITSKLFLKASWKGGYNIPDFTLEPNQTKPHKYNRNQNWKTQACRQTRFSRAKLNLKKYVYSDSFSSPASFPSFFHFSIILWTLSSPVLSEKSLKYQSCISVPVCCCLVMFGIWQLVCVSSLLKM